MKTKTGLKNFDAVGFMRAARRRLSEELADKTFEQQHAILSQSIPEDLKRPDKRRRTLRKRSV